MKTNNLRPLDSIESALTDLRSGKMIIVVDDENRENEGDFVMLAEFITPETINFMASIGRGLICTPLSEELAYKFMLPLQVQTNTASLGTAFTVTIDAKDKISTGISAADRAHTIKLLSLETTSASDFVRPGHVFPLIAKNGGVLERPGHTEASVDLAQLCGSAKVGVICEIMNPDGTMARYSELCDLAQVHNLKMISIEDLIHYRKKNESLITHVESVPLPTEFGQFHLYAFKSPHISGEHLAIVKGDTANLQRPNTLVRVHSECFTGDILGSIRCDCGSQLHQSLKTIEEAGSGIIIYLRQEGRGIGLFNKILTYQLQDKGMDTVDANTHLGFPVDARDYVMAAQILKYFKTTSIRLMTNNPEKILQLQKLGINEIERFPLEIMPGEKNAQYLFTKKTKLGHFLSQGYFNQ